ncbi:FMN-binding protein [Streptomyces sp. NPDC004327]|uniref:FMN-binding protein n=1 Tax=Streptomyces sp. NPDC004327 TaxID=3364699 RepID=UPI0036A616D0
MRRPLLSVAATATGICSLLALKAHHPADTPGGPTAPAGPGTSGAASGTLASGTYTGDAVDTRYGRVQVRVTVSGGRLTDVTVVRAPSENERDREIAGYAVPMLTGEALTAQNARIDTVSGATYTSDGYVRSLQSALDRAHA